MVFPPFGLIFDVKEQFKIASTIEAIQTYLSKNNQFCPAFLRENKNITCVGWVRQRR